MGRTMDATNDRTREDPDVAERLRQLDMRHDHVYRNFATAAARGAEALRPLLAPDVSADTLLDRVGEVLFRVYLAGFESGMAECDAVAERYGERMVAELRDMATPEEARVIGGVISRLVLTLPDLHDEPPAAGGEGA